MSTLMCTVLDRRQYKIGPEKGELFEGVLQQYKPTWALEIGTFLGYSAIRTARNLLQPGGKLLCIEANPQNAAVARQVVQYAGFDEQVQVIDGLSQQVIPQLPTLLAAIQQSQQLGLQEQHQQEQQQGFDVLFLDHCKDCYLPDLQKLEQLGLIRQGTTVMADNVIYPGAPGELLPQHSMACKVAAGSAEGCFAHMSSCGARVLWNHQYCLGTTDDAAASQWITHALPC